MLKTSFYRFVCLLLLPAVAVMAMTGDDDATRDANYIEGKKATADGQYEAAVEHLIKAVETDADNADVYNLLGYNHRKLERNDQALTYYHKALELDPEHREAHEYIGELYLKLEMLSKAKEHLDRLDSLCFFGCEEYDELEEAIKAFEAENN